MAITFSQGKNKQRNLILIAVLIIAAVFAIVYWIFSGNSPGEAESEQVATFKTIEIDFSLLEKEAIKNLKLLSDIEVFQGEIGRENPFIPY
jgi:flagellar basal body-associated protein FliL